MYVKVLCGSILHLSENSSFLTEHYWTSAPYKHTHIAHTCSVLTPRVECIMYIFDVGCGECRAHREWERHFDSDQCVMCCRYMLQVVSFTCPSHITSMSESYFHVLGLCFFIDFTHKSDVKWGEERNPSVCCTSTPALPASTTPVNACRLWENERKMGKNINPK